MSNNECLNLITNTTTNNYGNNNDKILSNKNFNCRNNNNPSTNEEYDGSVNKNLQIKILNWLIGVNMLKEGAIKPIEIPRMCANGVFLSDLINRLEGVNLLNIYFKNKLIKKKIFKIEIRDN